MVLDLPQLSYCLIPGIVLVMVFSSLHSCLVLRNETSLTNCTRLREITSRACTENFQFTIITVTMIVRHIQSHINIYCTLRSFMKGTPHYGILALEKPCPCSCSLLSLPYLYDTFSTVLNHLVNIFGIVVLALLDMKPSAMQGFNWKTTKQARVKFFTLTGCYSHSETVKF